MKPNINTGLFSVEALWKNSEIWWGDAQYRATDNNWKLQARSFFLAFHGALKFSMIDLNQIFGKMTF